MLLAPGVSKAQRFQTQRKFSEDLNVIPFYVTPHPRDSNGEDAFQICKFEYTESVVEVRKLDWFYRLAIGRKTSKSPW